MNTKSGWLVYLVPACILYLVVSATPADSYSTGISSALEGDYQTAYQELVYTAAQGNALAQFNVGLMYHAGLFVEADEAKAVLWYQFAADNDVLEAQEYLAIGYEEGWFGLEKNAAYAKYWQDRVQEHSGN